MRSEVMICCRWLLALLLVASMLSAQEEPAAPDAQTPESQTAEPASEVQESAAGASEPTLDASAAGEIFVNANSAYENSEHPQAAALYQSLLDAGMESGEIHYNLGNAALRGGELGRAVASYRRAQTFLPRDQDVAANLAFARRSAKDAIPPPEPSAVQATLFFWHYSMSRTESARAFLILNLLFWGLLAARIRFPSSEALRWSTLTLLILLVAVGASLAVRHLQPLDVAVVIPQEIEARSGTNEKDLVLFKLHAGTEVRVVDRREGSLRIELPIDEQSGWIREEYAQVVRW